MVGHRNSGHSGVSVNDRQGSQILLRTSREETRSSVQLLFKSCNRSYYLVKFRWIADDHSGHPSVVAAKMFDHLLGWHKRKSSCICTIQAEVRAIEEHARVSHAV